MEIKEERKRERRGEGERKREGEIEGGRERERERLREREKREGEREREREKERRWDGRIQQQYVSTVRTWLISNDWSRSVKSELSSKHLASCNSDISLRLAISISN